MKYSDFEKHIRNTFHNDTEDVDMDGLLTALNLPIDQQPAKKYGLWLFSSSLLLLLLAMLVYGFSTSQGDKLVNPISEVSSSIASQTMDEAALAPLPRHEDLKPAVVLDREEDDQDITSQTRANERNIQSHTESSTTALKINTKTSSTRSIIEKSSVLKYNAATVSNDGKRQDPSVADSRESSIPGSDAVKISTLASNTKQQTSLAYDMLTTNEVKALAIPNREVLVNDKVKCPSFKIGNKYFIDLIPEIGYMVPNRSLEDVSPEASNPITAIRKDQEKSLEGLQAALYARASRDDFPFYIKAGLSYTRISEQLPLAYDYIEYDTTRGIISLTTSPTGDTVTAIYGDIVSETQVTGNTTKHYYLHQWDLPLGIGYEKPLGGFTVGLEAGLHINLRTSITGNTLATEDTFREVTSTDVNRNVGLGYYGGIHVGRYINGIGDVYIAARARYVPDVSGDAVATDQSYMLYGLHAGYIYRF